MSKPILILNGQNLNLLGRREPEIYGSTTLAEVEAHCRARAEKLGRAMEFRQSNHEGVIVDWIQDALDSAAGIIINPAAFTHTSVAVLDALKNFKGPIIELHISNPHKREAFRHHSFLSEIAAGVIVGFGVAGYAMAANAAIDRLTAATAPVPTRTGS